MKKILFKFLRLFSNRSNFSFLINPVYFKIPGHESFNPDT